ncbi:MAG: minor capsid protein, partial [Methanobrevibacter sp.]|uniref:phage head morphogenesis protein n=1 Tax=Methanobrevibacter sp. TaxID=66852 RepID=UPI0025CCE416
MISATERRIQTNKLLMDICNFNKDLFDTSTLSPEEIRYYNKITDGFNKQIQFYIDWLDSDEAKRIFQDYTRYNDQAFKEIDEYTQDIIEDTKLTADEIINKIYDTGLTNGYKEIRRTKYYNDATKYGLKFLQNYNFTLINNVNEDLKKHIRTQIFNGIVAGETMPEVAQKILHAHETSLTGKTLSARQRAMMIARTETARAMTQGRLQSYANYGVREVKILTAGDDNVCAICRKAADKIYPIDEASNLVPFHPLCRCSVTAYIRHGILQGNPDNNVNVMCCIPSFSSEENNVY